jgi:hypothetical protein
MTASTSAPLSAAEIQQAQQRANAITAGATRAIQEGQFVFLAAVDGTPRAQP